MLYSKNRSENLIVEQKTLNSRNFISSEVLRWGGGTENSFLTPLRWRVKQILTPEDNFSTLTYVSKPVHIQINFTLFFSGQIRLSFDGKW